MADYLAGQSVDGFKIYTGYTYSNVYVVDADCVYSTGENNKYFVRKVDSEAQFIEEIEVGVDIVMVNTYVSQDWKKENFVMTDIKIW